MEQGQIQFPSSQLCDKTIVKESLYYIYNLFTGIKKSTKCTIFTVACHQPLWHSPYCMQILKDMIFMSNYFISYRMLQYVSYYF